jgi:hypothetical protein
MGPLAVVTWILWPGIEGLPAQFAFLAVASIVGSAVYLSIARALQLEEPWIVVSALAKVGRRRLGWT